MKPKAEHTITYHCLFCGHRWTEPDDIYDEDSTLDTSSCRKCLPTLRVGEQIRYGAAERSPADAVYADFKLKRGEVYTVKKVIGTSTRHMCNSKKQARTAHLCAGSSSPSISSSPVLQRRTDHGMSDHRITEVRPDTRALRFRPAQTLQRLRSGVRSVV